RSGDEARSDDAERCEVPVPSVFFRCGRFCVVCCCLLAELGCRLREAEVCAASLVCWSLIVCCLFSVRVVDMAATGTSSCPTSCSHQPLDQFILQISGLFIGKLDICTSLGNLFKLSTDRARIVVLPLSFLLDSFCDPHRTFQGG